MTGEEKDSEERFGQYALNVLGAVADEMIYPFIWART